MQALSMIDMGASAEMIAPAKRSEPQDKQFGKVLNDQQQSEPTQRAEAKQPAAEQRQAKQAAKSEEQSAQQPKAEQKVPEKQDQAVDEAAAEAKPKLQQVVVNLMKVIAGGETPELTEEFGSSEELLKQLVQQLEGSDLKGEQVLAGIDLSALVEQLQSLGEEGGEEQLEQLVAQLEEQLTSEEGLLANAELAAMSSVTDPQASAPKLVENLAQARQILQKAIDSVASQQTKGTENVEQVATEAEGNGEESGEELDPRFAGLLKPRSEGRQQQQSLRQQMQGDAVKVNPNQMKAGETAQLGTEMTSEQAEIADFAEMLTGNPKQGLETLGQQAQGQVQPTSAQAQSVAAKVMPQNPTIQLPSGQQVAESQIFDQVVTRFSGSLNGDSGRMVLRLQPAELGSLRIELMVEGDRIRANLQAQSIQVQEVLERNLPQLRNALAEQGLKIDQFQVDINRDQNQQDQFEQMAQQQQQRQEQQQPGWEQPWEAEEQIIPLAHLMQNGGGGISLHV